ncbi:MAG: DNA polymerase II small subunit, partial [Thermococcales archaeon 44_46]
MDEFVRGLMSNNYLITPPAYFLLSEHYNRDFTLPELIKFAKARGTFIIDDIIAEEFLESKGIIIRPKHLEKFMTSKKPEEQSPEEFKKGQTLEISEAEEAPAFISEAVVEEAEKLEIPESQEHLTSEIVEEPSMGEIEETSEEAVSELVEEVETLEEDKEAVEEFAGEEETEESFDTNGEENGENGEVKRKVV